MKLYLVDIVKIGPHEKCYYLSYIIADVSYKPLECSEYDTESSDLESIISSDCQDYDTNNECQKYPDMKLDSSWDVYFLRNDVEDWSNRLVYVTSFDTIKGFWAVYQHMKLPSHLPQGCDYMIFKR
mgnify:CR=1 FL=1